MANIAHSRSTVNSAGYETGLARIGRRQRVNRFPGMSECVKKAALADQV
jgi:hypothetical protein